MGEDDEQYEMNEDQIEGQPDEGEEPDDDRYEIADHQVQQIMSSSEGQGNRRQFENQDVEDGDQDEMDGMGEDDIGE